jgi:hypothetical protein
MPDNETSNANREHKSSVFADFFRDRDRLLAMYGALKGRSYPKDAEVEFVTLDDVLFQNMLMTEFDINVAKEVWMDEAWQDGKAEGKAEGIEIGEARGETRGKLIIARNLLMRGYSLEDVAEITDYPIETLKEKLGIAD